MSRILAKDFITFLDYSEAELISLLDLTDTLCRAWRTRTLPQNLSGKSVALIWDAEGFRNRVAMELGIAAMGGLAVQVPGKLDVRESIEDVAAYLDNWFDSIVARTQDHAHMERLARAAWVPVVNARTDFNHPCEILGDLAYVRAQRGHLDGLKVVFVGEATNLCYPWMEAAARLPIHVVQVCPAGFAVDPEFLDAIQHGATGTVAVSQDLDGELHDAHVVYTDCWPKRAALEEAAQIAEQFAPYQVTAGRLDAAGSDVLFLPCPPVTRGEEVSDDAMQRWGHQVFAAKEYLLHAQNAVLTALL